MRFSKFRVLEKTRPVGSISVAISSSALLHNLHEFKKISPSVAPVLKSNAFGHGLIEVAKILEKESPPFFIVDALEEVILIRKNKIKTPILTIGYVSSAQMEMYNMDHVSYTIISYEMLKNWCQTISKKIKIHLKIDTGMNRQGISLDRVDEAITLLVKSPHLILEGICTHLADADNIDPSYTIHQIEKWNNLTDLFKSKFSSLIYFHISNTAGHSHSSAIINCSFSRLGVGLYGLTGNGKLDSLISLKPVMKVSTIITGTKTITKGSKVGYSGTYTAVSDIKLATLPVGYGVGYDRRLSNKAVVKIGGSFFPVVGRVSMNITIIDISSLEVGDNFEYPVVLISNVEADANSVVNIAKTCGTNPHEIVTGISPLLERIVID